MCSIAVIFIAVVAAAATVPPEALRDSVADHSLMPPLLARTTHDVSNKWTFGGSAVVSDHFVRLTPNSDSREGSLWNSIAVQVHSWTAFFGFRAHSKSPLGGDGFAFWVTRDRYMEGGPVVGAPESGIQGLGLIFDTFDNDGGRDNPAVHVVFSKSGTAQGDFDPGKDYSAGRVGGCVFDFRNQNVVDVRVDYNAAERTVRVVLASATTVLECATVQEIDIPAGYFFGFTSHTGQLADNHDIHYFSVVGKER